MKTPSKFIVFALVVIFVLAGFVLWLFHSSPSRMMAYWVSPIQSVHIEWSHTDLAPGDPTTVVTAFGSFGPSIPKLRCSSKVQCSAPTKGTIYNQRPTVNHYQFDIPIPHLDQVETFLAGSQTVCTSAELNHDIQAVGVLCTNPTEHKFLFYGVD